MKRRPDFSQQALAFDLPLYVPGPDDELYTPTNPGPTGGTPEPVNLNAIAYYALCGLKPKRICTLVGTSHATIWNNGRMRDAYEAGAAYHELWLRTRSMQEVDENPGMLGPLLSRAAGPAEVDHEDSKSPVEADRTKRVIKFEVETTVGDPEVDDLRKLLDRKLKEMTGA